MLRMYCFLRTMRRISLEVTRRRAWVKALTLSSSDCDDGYGHRKNCIPDFIKKYTEEVFRRHFRLKKNVIHGPYEAMFKRTHSGAAFVMVFGQHNFLHKLQIGLTLTASYIHYVY